MMGYGEKGLIPRICEGIFDRAAKSKIKDPDITYLAEVHLTPRPLLPSPQPFLCL